jgi:hypothetical protein
LYVTASPEYEERSGTMLKIEPVDVVLDVLQVYEEDSTVVVLEVEPDELDVVGGVTTEDEDDEELLVIGESLDVEPRDTVKVLEEDDEEEELLGELDLDKTA